MVYFIETELLGLLQVRQQCCSRAPLATTDPLATMAAIILNEWTI